MSLNYDLPEDANMIRDSIRDFAENVIKPQARELDAKEKFSPEITKQMGELGLFGFAVPGEYGGNGFGYLPYMVAVEELARIDSSQAATVAAHNSLGIGPIYYFGNEEQKKKYLPPLCSGEKVWGFGLTEPDAGSDAGGTKTNAVKDGNEWVINGAKMFITNASTEYSLGSTVQAVTGKRPDGKKEYSCFLVERGTKGFETKTMHEKMVWRASITSELFFDDCRVPEESILGKQGEGFRQMLTTLDRGRLSIAAMGLGCAQGAFEMAVKYAKERKQFGKSISTFQINAFKLADMDTEIECARNLLYKAAWLCDQGRDYQKHASMAKLYCAEVAHRCVNHAVQLHGGYGLMKEYDVERFYRDQKILEIGEGTSEICRLVISRCIGCYDV
ncbi:MAG: acyl-CoA dehydrogenase family protein [Candidatus Aminicenantes bacterium]|nr:acyl-CoA dehydrogenase family protein [Candidatus Aminicenantes bacterium]